MICGKYNLFLITSVISADKILLHPTPIAVADGAMHKPIIHNRSRYLEFLQVLTIFRLQTSLEEFIETPTIFGSFKYVVRCVIWYHFYNLENLKNTHMVLTISNSDLHILDEVSFTKSPYSRFLCHRRFWECLCSLTSFFRNVFNFRSYSFLFTSISFNTYLKTCRTCICTVL